MATTFRGINLHPDNNLISSVTKKAYDVIVIGSGPVGRALAARTAAAGLSTIIVEEQLFGGDCPFWACIPSKALLRPAEALEAAKQVSGSREMIQEEKEVFAKAVFGRRDAFVQNWNDGMLVELSKSQNCDIVRGRGVLSGRKRVKVANNYEGDEIELTANQGVVLATGSSPIIPDIPGLREVDVWTPREATAANFVPEHLVILGGGVVGAEMATFYGNLGKVTLITTAERLLPSFEPEASNRVRDALTAKGVDIYTSTKVTLFKKAANSNSKFEAVLSNGKLTSGSTVLIAAGRTANTNDIGLEQFGITQTQKIPVDDSLSVAKTSWLYAIGDANVRNPLTHMGVYQARTTALTIIAKSKGEAINPEAWSDFSATADHTAASQIVMTDPNIASAGLTLYEAQKKGYKVKEVTTTFQFPGAWLHAEFNYDGWAQWVIDTERHVLVGATFVGRQAGDLLHASTVAIVGQVPVPKLWHAVAGFPSMSEIYTALLNVSGY